MTAYDVSVRALQCGHCGAPVTTSVAGGTVDCTFCGGTSAIVRRAVDRKGGPPPSMADEVARVSRLKAQLRDPVEGNAYDLSRAPHGLTTNATKEQLQQAWDEAKKTAVTTAQQGRDLVWIAIFLARHHVESLPSRAILETALDLVLDAGHRHLLRCELVEEAVSVGDLKAAEGWLAECEPAHEVIELDSAYRDAAVSLRAAQGKFPLVLEIVGHEHGHIPLHASVDLEASMLRIHALEQMGRSEPAMSEFRKTAGRSGHDVLLRLLERARLAKGTLRRAKAQRAADTAAAQRQRAAHEAQLAYAEQLAARKSQLVRLGTLVQQRNRKRTGLRALAPSVGIAPLFAIAVWVAVTIPRCTSDYDPFMGVQGNVLCPMHCAGCRGPWQVETIWHHPRPGESTTNGPDYYCRPPKKNKDMPRAYLQLGASAGASTFLMGLILGLGLSLLFGIQAHLTGSRARGRLDQRIADLARSIGHVTPEQPRSGGGKELLMALGFALGSAAVAIAVILGDVG